MQNQPTTTEIKIIGNFQYKAKHLLGEGAFGKVYKGQNIQTNEDVAIKKIDLVTFEKDQYLKQSIQKEIEILKKFNHENIVRFIDLVASQRSLYIITEFCEDGDLRQYLRRKKLKENEVISMMIQITKGFKELQKNGIIHRDLKPANILNNKGIIKLADFGFAKFVDNYSNELLRSCVGSPLYMAPQVLNRQAYTTKCDIWSLGVIYYELLYNDVPWNGRSETELLKNIQTKPLQLKPNIPISKFSEDFLRKTLARDETERTNWDTVFEMFDNQENSLKQNSELKKDYHFNKSTQELIIKPPDWLNLNPSPQQNLPVKDQQAVKSQNDAMKQLKILQIQRQELQFRHFVNIEIFTQQNLCKKFFKKELTYETFYALLSKVIMSQTKALFSQVDQLTSQDEFLHVRDKSRQYLTILKNEQEYAYQFYEDVRNYLDLLGTLPNLLGNEEFRNIYEKELSDPYHRTYEDALQKRGLHMVKETLFDLQKQQPKQEEKQGCIEFLYHVDYILDMFLVRKQLIKGMEVDYDSIHLKTSGGVQDTKKLCDNLLYKLRQVESM